MEGYEPLASLRVRFECADGRLQRYLGLFEVAEEAELLWAQDQQRMASALDASGSPAHPVDVLLQTTQTLQNLHSRWFK